MVHHDTCPLCTGKVTNKFTGTDFFVTGETFPVYMCTNCRFVFTQDHPSEQEIARYYESEDYISHSDISEGILNRVYRFSREIMLRKKTRLIKKKTGRRTGSLLDIGSGTGYFANAMKNEGWDVRGIEINAKARLFAKEKFGIDTISPDNTDLLNKGSFDCITLWHVLEHFSDPSGYMDLISGLLKPDGTCIIALPNCSSFDAVHYREHWAAWDVPRHLWHFTPETFELFCNKAGFEIRGIQRLPLDVFYISILSEKYRKSGMSFVQGGIWGGIFWLLSIFNKERSSSLIYIIRKK